MREDLSKNKKLIKEKQKRKWYICALIGYKLIVFILSSILENRLPETTNLILLVYNTMWFVDPVFWYLIVKFSKSTEKIHLMQLNVLYSGAEKISEKKTDAWNKELEQVIKDKYKYAMQYKLNHESKTFKLDRLNLHNCVFSKKFGRSTYYLYFALVEVDKKWKSYVGAKEYNFIEANDRLFIVVEDIQFDLTGKKDVEKYDKALELYTVVCEAARLSGCEKW